MFRKWFRRKMARLSGKLTRKSEIATNEGNYEKAFKYLNWSEKVASFVGSPPLLCPIGTTQRIELNFLTHNYDYVLENIEIPINAIEKTKLDWSQADRDYLKMYNYNFVLLCYIFLDDGDKALETYNHVYALLDKDVSEKMVFSVASYLRRKLPAVVIDTFGYADAYPIIDDPASKENSSCITLLVGDKSSYNNCSLIYFACPIQKKGCFLGRFHRCSNGRSEYVLR